jgi:putative exporter of polyketide antibiotics
MTAEVRRPAAAAAPSTIPLLHRIYGLGSVFGKTLRDSRRAMLLLGGFLTMIWFITGTSMATAFGTTQSRLEVVELTRTLPAFFLGLYGGDATNVDTLGGLANWRYGIVFFVFSAFWSIIALSGTLVVEARRGSMEFVAAGRSSRARIALEKVGGHAAAMVIVMAFVAVVSWLIGQLFYTLPGDHIAIEAAFGYTIVMGLTALAGGAIAFALAPLVGRGGAAGIAATVMLASWLVNGFRDSIPAFESLSAASYYTWTAGHRPIAGNWDWPSLLPVLAIVLVGFAIGIAAFARRDLGDIGSLRTVSLPAVLLGIRGPLSRAFGERLTGAIGWGIGIGVYSLIIGASADSLRESLRGNETIQRLFEVAFPNFDLNDPGVALELMFVGFGFLAIGLAAAAILNGWASDEADGRLEMLLATPQDRLRWMVRSGLGVYAAIVVVTIVVAISIAIGVAITGDDPVTPIVGTLALTLFALAVAGAGMAIGGLFRAGLAAPAAALVVLVTFMIDILVPALKLPEEVRELALTAHFGSPMLGTWDLVGIVASLAIAFGGLGIGAWGFARRDLKS